MAVDVSLTPLDRSQREELALVQVAQRLHKRFPSVPQELIDETVQVQYHHFDGSRIRDFVPIFVERNAREDLLKFG